MERTEVRELVRLAQAAELEGDKVRAVELLEKAARLHLDGGHPARAASLFRHALRLAPERADLKEALACAEVASASHEVPERRLLEVPQRGPVAADPTVESWCSFCCRPKPEAGPMIAGAAGAFICASCIEAARPMASRKRAAAAPGGPTSPIEAAIAAVEPHAVLGGAHVVPEAPPVAPTAPAGLTPASGSSEDTPADGLIPAAVVLSQYLGWSLTEVRSLSVAERREAVALVTRGAAAPSGAAQTVELSARERGRRGGPRRP